MQGEHNINWADEYHLLEDSKNYYDRMKNIAQENGVGLNGCLENYREDEDDEEYLLWDWMGFHLNEITREQILKIVHG